MATAEPSARASASNTIPAKGLPPEAAGLTTDQIAVRGLSLARGDLPLPVAAVSRPAVDHNIAAMASWCDRHGAGLAPHGKTTLAPELFARQLAAGAWGMTVTTARHAQLAVDAGARRLIVANQVVDPVDLRTLAALADGHALEVLVFVDSIAGLRRLAAAARAAPGRISVLVEMGLAGGRTGVRSTAELLALLSAVRDAPAVGLAGVSAFEGLLGVERRPGPGAAEPGGSAGMRAFLADVAAAIGTAREQRLLDERAIVSSGGSYGFDLVVEHLAGLAGELILRSGCYVVHDHGTYARQSPLQAGNAVGLVDEETLRPALTLWAHVLSTPEPGAAVVGLGRRDAGHDAGPPVPLARVLGPGVREPVTGWTPAKMWDQHLLLEGRGDATALAVGDVLTFGISHPCTTVDKWRTLVEVDDLDTVVGLVPTWF